MKQLDRGSNHYRPSSLPLMHQNWGKLLFMHWPIDARLLRPLIPDRLTIDTFEGKAWIAVVPFTMWGVRLNLTPAVPRLSSFHELNVRTYVRLEDVPGVWFLSLDTNSAPTVWGARKFFHLPYHYATIKIEQIEATIDYSLLRRVRGVPRSVPATFSAKWNIGNGHRRAEVGSLEFFLVERYCLYSTSKNRLYRARIYHEPWPLQAATLRSYASSMVESHGLPPPAGEPLLHYAEKLSVDIWPLKEV